jgi:hypothetical protein
MAQASIALNAVTLTIAKLAAVKEIKRRMQAQGLKVAHIERRDIELAARAYLSDHPELIQEAAETVQRVPGLRVLSDKEERRKAKAQRIQLR